MRQEQVEQIQALTRDWNQKSRIEQIIIRHQIWNTSDLPNSEYTASWSDVKLLIDELERLRTALEKIAAYDDEGANARLQQTGSYSSFDEPDSVRTAREVLASINALNEQGKESE